MIGGVDAEEEAMAATKDLLLTGERWERWENWEAMGDANFAEELLVLVVAGALWLQQPRRRRILHRGMCERM